MGTCEMCGESGKLRQTKVEGARLKLCGDCQDLGEPVEQSSTGVRKPRRSRTSTPQEEILPGYHEDVKQARESRDYSVKDLAEALKEKESVVRRVESGKLSPDRDLAGKFEKELGVEIYGNLPEEPEASSSSSSGERTVGDVAEVKKK